MTTLLMMMGDDDDESVPSCLSSVDAQEISEDRNGDDNADG